MRLQASLLVVLTSVALPTLPCLAQYTVNNIGSLGGSFVYTYPNAINNSGQVVGSAENVDFSVANPFRTAANSAINPATDNLGVLPGVGVTSASATSINNSGQVVGNALIPSSACAGCFTSLAFAPIPAIPLW